MEESKSTDNEGFDDFLSEEAGPDLDGTERDGPPEFAEFFNWDDGAALERAFDSTEPTELRTPAAVATDEAMTSGGTSRKRSAKSCRRKKKPKGMPKRPLSAYNLFFQKVRQDILQNDGSVGFAKLAKIVGEQWKVLPDKERRVYEKLADQDSVRYRTQLAEYEEEKRKKRSAALRSTFPMEANTKSGVEGLGRFALGVNDLPGEGPSVGMEAVPFPFSVVSDSNSFPLPAAESKPPAFNAAAGIYPLSEALNAQQQANLPSVFLPPSQTPQGPVILAPPPGATRVAVSPQLLQPQSFVGNEESRLTIPSGMEVVFPDATGQQRKYRIKYDAYRMSREAAEHYIQSFSRQAETLGGGASAPLTVRTTSDE